MKAIYLVWILSLSSLAISLNCNAQQQVQQPTAAQVLQEHIRQENIRTQVWADRQTEGRDIREVKQRRK